MMCMSLPVVVAFRISDDFKIKGLDDDIDDANPSPAIIISPVAKISLELFFCMVLLFY